MTWNVYQGADQSSIFDATTPIEFINTVGSAYNRIQQTNFIEKSRASIADQINKTLPDLIGLQKVILLRTYSFLRDDIIQSMNVYQINIHILIDTLTWIELVYEPIVIQEGIDIQVLGLTSTEFLTLDSLLGI